MLSLSVSLSTKLLVVFNLKNFRTLCLLCLFAVKHFLVRAKNACEKAFRTLGTRGFIFDGSITHLSLLVGVGTAPSDILVNQKALLLPLLQFLMSLGDQLFCAIYPGNLRLLPITL